MKRTNLLFTFLFFAIIAFGQNEKGLKISFPENVNEPLTQKERTMIEEVYHTKANEIVYNNDSFLKDIKHLLRNRITIYEDNNPKTQKNGTLLSEVPLFNKYNTALKRDTSFNIENFNPLKYQLDFFANGTYVYRIDDTNFFIQVTSQHRKFN